MNLLLSFMTIGSVFVFLSLLVADLIILAFYRAEINCIKSNPKYIGNSGYYYKLLKILNRLTIIYAGLSVVIILILSLTGKSVL